MEDTPKDVHLTTPLHSKILLLHSSLCSPKIYPFFFYFNSTSELFILLVIGDKSDLFSLLLHKIYQRATSLLFVARKHQQQKISS